MKTAAKIELTSEERRTLVSRTEHSGTIGVEGPDCVACRRRNAEQGHRGGLENVAEDGGLVA